MGVGVYALCFRQLSMEGLSSVFLMVIFYTLQMIPWVSCNYFLFNLVMRRILATRRDARLPVGCGV